MVFLKFRHCKLPSEYYFVRDQPFNQWLISASLVVCEGILAIIPTKDPWELFQKSGFRQIRSTTNVKNQLIIGWATTYLWTFLSDAPQQQNCSHHKGIPRCLLHPTRSYVEPNWFLHKFPFFWCYVPFGRYFTSIFYLRCWMCTSFYRKICHAVWDILNQRVSNHIESPDSIKTSWLITRLVDTIREPCVSFQGVKLNNIRYADLGIGWWHRMFFLAKCESCKSFLCRTCTADNTMFVYFLLVHSSYKYKLFFEKEITLLPSKKGVCCHL